MSFDRIGQNLDNADLVEGDSIALDDIEEVIISLHLTYRQQSDADGFAGLSIHPVHTSSQFFTEFACLFLSFDEKF